MITHTYQKFAPISLLGLIVISLTACSTPRILVSTGTTLGLKATPGDGKTQPPQVTLGYKRAEVAFVPTKIQMATSSAVEESTEIAGNDAFSVLAAVHFDTIWFGDTNLQSFVGTGIAARDVQTQPSFKSEFSKGSYTPPDTNSACIDKWLSSGDQKQKEANAKVVNDWLTQNGHKGQLPIFLYDDKFKEERTNFISEKSITCP